MNTYQYFQQKLAEYAPYEDVVALKLIQKYKLEPIYTKCITNAFDFQLSDGIKYELKCDVAGAKTGNCFLEFRGFSKLSGISVTQADFYIITFNLKEYYNISVATLKQMISTGNYRIMKTRQTQTRGYLIPVREIIDASELI